MASGLARGVEQAGAAIAAGITKRKEGKAKEAKGEKAANSIEQFFSKAGLSEEQQASFGQIKDIMINEVRESGDILAGFKIGSALFDFKKFGKEQTPLEKATMEAKLAGAEIADLNNDGKIDSSEIASAQQEAELDFLRRKKEVESSVSAESQARAAKLKKQTEGEAAFLRSQGAVNTTFDQFLDFGNDLWETTGLAPGSYLGIAEKVIPGTILKYKDALIGAAIESGAQVARLAIPGARGINMVNVFARSQARIGATTEANIENTVATNRNNLDKAISDDIFVLNEETGKMVPIRETIIDEKTGKRLSELSLTELARAKNDITKKFQAAEKKSLMTRAYRKNPNLFKSDKARKEAKGYVLEQNNKEKAAIQARLEQLRASRAQGVQ